MYHRLSCLERPLVGWDRRFSNEVRGNLQTVSEKSAETSGLSEPEGLPDAESGDSDTLLATPTFPVPGCHSRQRRSPAPLPNTALWSESTRGRAGILFARCRPALAAELGA